MSQDCWGPSPEDYNHYWNWRIEQDKRERLQSHIAWTESTRILLNEGPVQSGVLKARVCKEFNLPDITWNVAYWEMISYELNYPDGQNRLSLIDKKATASKLRFIDEYAVQAYIAWGNKDNPVIAVRKGYQSDKELPSTYEGYNVNLPRG